MPNNDFGNSDFDYSNAGGTGQGGPQDAPPPGYAGAAGPEGYQNIPGQFGSQGYQPPPGPFSFQASQGQPGYQGTPTPTGYQSPSQFGQPGFGNGRMWSAAGGPGAGLGGGIGRLLLGILAGPGVFGRRGRNRYFWYLRIVFWLVIIGICLYVGFTKHTWISTCTGDCGD